MKNILVVDDDAAIRNMLYRHISKNMDCEISMAENGREALEVLSAQKPDLILMDLKMPGMDGIAAIREIRKNPDCVTLPIILLSAEDDKEKWVEAFDAGANDFIPKPYHKSELFARMETHLKISALTNELLRKNAQLENERAFARKVQKSLLPRQLNLEGLDIATVYRASDDIGGDFFDAWESDGMVHLYAGDICGHGTSSALLMAACVGMLRSLGQTAKSPRRMLTSLNKLFCEIVTDSGLFLTMIYALYSREMGEITFVSAGHPPVFLTDKGGMRTVTSTGPVLGWDPDDCWDVVRYPFHAGDSLFLYTDGLTEAKSRQDEEFGYERVKAQLKERLEPTALIHRMLEKVSSFADHIFEDDLTMVAVKKR